MDNIKSKFESKIYGRSKYMVSRNTEHLFKRMFRLPMQIGSIICGTIGKSKKKDHFILQSL
jgi:hypothetical protein